MIRELTKSATSFSWALSLLTLKQAASLLTPGQGRSDLFAPMTQVAVSELDESMKGFFRSGDSIQSRMVDMTFSMMNPFTWFSPGGWQNMGNWINPAHWMSSAANLTRAATSGCGGQAATHPQMSPPTLGSTPTSMPGGPPGSAVPVSNQSAAAGWGPMPGS